MRKWAFATSGVPVGLGLSDAEFWFLSHEEFSAKMECWNGYHESFYQLRADIHNSSENLNREDKRRWTAQDFGAAAAPQADPRRTFTPEEADRMVRATFGGNLTDPEGKPVSALKKMKGQSLPPSLQAKIKVVEVKAPKARNPRAPRVPAK